jgi:hypothetical protein
MDLGQTLAKPQSAFLFPPLYPLSNTRSGEETRSFVATLISFTSTHRHSVAYTRSAYAFDHGSQFFFCLQQIFFINLILSAFVRCDLAAVGLCWVR